VKIEKRKIKDLTPYDRNPRLNDKAVEAVLESLRHHGQVKPIVLSAKGHPFEQEVICAGHTTTKALTEFGAEEVNVVLQKFKDEAEFLDFNIRDNKTAEGAEWDEKELAALNAEFDLHLEEMDFDLSEYEDEMEGETDEDEVPEVPEEPNSKLGQIWKLGEHRLMCGDSTDKEQVEALMDGEKADMVFTDIPYNISQESNGLRELDYGDWDKGVGDIGLKCFAHGYGESFYFFCGDEQLSGILSAMKEAECSTRSFVWKKPNPTVMNGQNLWLPSQELCAYGKKSGATYNLKCEHAFYEGAPNGARVHPNQKPVELPEKCIIASSNNGETVLDFFGGSGSTLIACEKTKRKARLMELDPKYCDVIIKRWEDFTGNEAELVN